MSKTPSNTDCELPCPLLFCNPTDHLCEQTPEFKKQMYVIHRNNEAKKDRNKAKHRRFYWRHKPELQKKYRASNNQASRRYRKNNRATRLLTERNYRAANKDEINRKRREKRREGLG